MNFINFCIEDKFDMIKVRENVLDLIGYDDSEIRGLNQNETISNINKNAYLIGFILQGISLVTILDLLAKILLDSIKQKTPFVKKNIKRMKLMAICSILYSHGLLYFIIIIMVTQLFKYGYELQVESDELL